MGYGVDEVDGYDEYDDYDDEEQYEDYDDEEEEVQVEEERKPTAEELEYLELRKRLKERYRKNLKKGSSSAIFGSQEKKNRLPYDNYGSFFGPSKPVISQRVIQESKSFLENQHLANKVLQSHRGNEKTTGSKAGVPRRLPKFNPVQAKVQKIKVSRDYSFLSNDAELPAPKKDQLAQIVSRPNSEARPAPLPIKNKQPLINNGRNVHNAREERRPNSLNGEVHSNAGSHKLTPGSKPNLTSMDNRRQHSSSNGLGPGRPGGPKPLPAKMPTAPMGKKASVSGVKNVLPGTNAQPSSRLPPPGQKKQWEQRKSLEEPNRGKMGPKQTDASSAKSQMNRPVKQQVPSRPMVQDHRPSRPIQDQRPSRPIVQDQRPSRPIVQDQRPSRPMVQDHRPSRPMVQDHRHSRPMVQDHRHSRPMVQDHRPSRPMVQDHRPSRPVVQDQRPKKKPLRRYSDDEDGEDAMAFSMLRSILGPRKYSNYDDDDDSDMEAGFDDIMKEEKRSAKIARKEDEEQLRLIEEEERQERMRKLAKKRKLSQQS